MGADSIYFELNGKASREDVLRAFKNKQAEDADYNGHREGYSGDFQTVHRVEFHDKIFDSEHEAMEYCLKKAEKWTTVVAVKYKVQNKLKPNVKYKRLETKKNTLSNEYAALELSIADETKTALAAKKFVTCQGCKSKLNTLHQKYSSCRVCGADLTSTTAKRKLSKANERLDKARNAFSAYAKTLQEKAGASGTQWLIAGWGAC